MELIALVFLAMLAAMFVVFGWLAMAILRELQIVNLVQANIYAVLLAYDEGEIGLDSDGWFGDDDDKADEREAAQWN